MSDLKAVNAAASKTDEDNEASPGGSSRSVSLTGSLKGNSKVKVTEASERSIQNSTVPSHKNIVDMTKFHRTPNDTNNPSYTNLTLPYSVVARMRYRYAGAKQKAQFRKELEDHELLQSKAIDGCRIHREFCNAVLKNADPEEMIRLTDKQKARIEEILDRKDDFCY